MDSKLSSENKNNISNDMSRLIKLTDKDRVNVLLEVYKQAQEYDRHCDRSALTTGSIFIPFSLGIIVFTLSSLDKFTLNSIIMLGIVSEFFILIWSIMYYRWGKQQDTITRPLIERIASELNMDIVLIPSKSKQRHIIRYLFRYFIPLFVGIIWIILIYFF